MLIYILFLVIIFIIFTIDIQKKEKFQSNTCNINDSVIAGNSIDECLINCKREAKDPTNINSCSDKIIENIYEKNFETDNIDCNSGTCIIKNDTEISNCLKDDTNCQNDICFKKCTKCTDPVKCRWRYLLESHDLYSGGKLPEKNCDNPLDIEGDIVVEIPLNQSYDNLKLKWTVSSNIIDLFDKCGIYDNHKSNFKFIINILEKEKLNMTDTPIKNYIFNYCECNPKFIKSEENFEDGVYEFNRTFNPYIKPDKEYIIFILLKNELTNYIKKSNNIDIYIADNSKDKSHINKNNISKSEIIKELLSKTINIDI